MVIQDPIDLCPQTWYYDDSADILFKLLENNIIHNHDEQEYDGYIIVKHPDTPPEKIEADVLIEQMEIGEIEKLDRHSTNTVSTAYPQSKDEINTSQSQE